MEEEGEGRREEEGGGEGGEDGEEIEGDKIRYPNHIPTRRPGGENNATFGAPGFVADSFNINNSTSSSNKKNKFGKTVVKKQRNLVRKASDATEAPDAPRYYKSAYICFLMDKMSKKSDNQGVEMPDMMKVYVDSSLRYVIILP